MPWSDVMKRIAAPMVGGIITSFVLVMLIYPVIFTMWKWRSEVQPRRGDNAPVTRWPRLVEARLQMIGTISP